ncbi:hypothetical protein CYMTET_30148, partial [Cymbomonas tetramitiformis]
MRLNLFKSLWGVVSIDGGTKSLPEAIDALRKNGYTGVECSVRLAKDLDLAGGSKGEFTSLMKEYGLQWIPILFSSGPVDGWDPFLPDAPRSAHSGSVQQHAKALAGQAEDALAFDIPIPFFNCHSGHD